MIAIKLNPTSSECHFNLGSAYKDNNDIDNALKYFKEALKYDPENIDCLINIANMYELKTEYLDSFNFYVRALNINS